MLLQEDSAVSHTLIVDDNLLNRRLLVAFMKKHGIQYEEASNGLEALKKYQESIVKFDVILMDMSVNPDVRTACETYTDFVHLSQVYAGHGRNVCNPCDTRT
jgi:CheY-like chemotaxis protein